jgi:hypothetical protein
MTAGRMQTYRSLKRKNFADARHRSKDHLYLEYMVDDAAVFYTCVSHGGGKDLTPNQVRAMSEECHLSREDFLRLARCTMSKEEYRLILIRDGVIAGP